MVQCVSAAEHPRVSAVVVSSSATSRRAGITARSAAENGGVDCLVVDVDHTYEPSGTETVLVLGDLVKQLGVVEEARVAAATLDPDSFEFYAELLGAASAPMEHESDAVVVLEAGVLVLHELQSFAAAPRGGLAVLPRTDPDALKRRMGSSMSLRRAANDFREIKPPIDEVLPQFARAVYALGPHADLATLRELASDWRIALTALDVYAVSQPTVIVRDDAALIAAWRGAPDCKITRDDAGSLLLDGNPVLAVDLSHFNPATPWVLDAAAPIAPAIRLSEHAALRELGAEVAPSFDHEKSETRRAHGRPALLDRVLRTEARRAQLLRGSIPDVLGLDSSASGPDDIEAWATELVPPGHRYPVARYLAGVRAGRWDLQRAFPQVPGNDSANLARWALEWGLNEDFDTDLMVGAAEATLAAQPQAAAKGRRQPGVNLVGYLAGEMGLGESARLMDAALHSAGVPTSTFDVSRGLLSRQTAMFRQSEPVLYDTTLACVNGSDVEQAFKQLGDVASRTRRIGMWYWELEDFPVGQQAGFHQVHEVWAATDFIRDAIAAHSPGLPVRTVMPPLPQREDEEVGPLPERFGIPSDRPFFLFTFDYLSIAARKNPYGLVEAFTRAFPAMDTDGPRLVIKTINGDKTPADSERLRIESADNPNVIIIDEYLDNHERHMLVAHCAAYVSLHKAEGLGLTIAEAMAWGKPVIVTAYGGPLQFLNDQNSFLVGWEASSVPEKMGPYEQGSRWAEPDLDDAARLMRLVVDDPAAAAAVGEQAGRDIRDLHNIEAAGVRIREVLEQGGTEWEAARAAKRAQRQEARRGAQQQPPASVTRRAVRKARRASAALVDRIRR
jgi:glycosyltransferase involved in cell wall biosynthesis